MTVRRSAISWLSSSRSGDIQSKWVVPARTAVTDAQTKEKDDSEGSKTTEKQWGPGKCIMIDGLPPVFNRDMLRDHLSIFGKVLHCGVRPRSMMRSKDYNQKTLYGRQPWKFLVPTYGYACFEELSDAMKALRVVNGAEIGEFKLEARPLTKSLNRQPRMSANRKTRILLRVRVRQIPKEWSNEKLKEFLKSKDVEIIDILRAGANEATIRLPNTEMTKRIRDLHMHEIDDVNTLRVLPSLSPTLRSSFLVIPPMMKLYSKNSLDYQTAMLAMNFAYEDDPARIHKELKSVLSDLPVTKIVVSRRDDFKCSTAVLMADKRTTKMEFVKRLHRQTMMGRTLEVWPIRLVDVNMLKSEVPTRMLLIENVPTHLHILEGRDILYDMLSKVGHITRLQLADGHDAYGRLYRIARCKCLNVEAAEEMIRKLEHLSYDGQLMPASFHKVYVYKRPRFLTSFVL